MRSKYIYPLSLKLDGSGGGSNDVPEMFIWPSEYEGDSWAQSFPITICEERIRQMVYACYRDRLNHYAIRWGGGSGQHDRASVQLVQLVNGTETILDERPNQLKYATTYTVLVSYLNDRFDVTFGETIVVDVTNFKAS